MPVVRNLQDFDTKSGNALERLIFNNRLWMVVVCALVTVILGYFAATKLTLNASFEKMIPQSQPYIKNYLDNKRSCRGLGNSIRVVVENTEGDIFDPKYLEVLKQINDELFLMPGVDRAWMKSLWTPAVRWNEVTEEGFQGGPVMPDNYDGSPAEHRSAQCVNNLARSGIAGDLVANDFKSSMIFVPLLDKDPNTGKRLDYRAFSDGWRKMSATSTSCQTPAKTSRPRSRPDQDPHHRLCQVGRRSDRRPGAGHGVFCGARRSSPASSSSSTPAACAARFC